MYKKTNNEIFQTEDLGIPAEKHWCSLKDKQVQYQNFLPGRVDYRLNRLWRSLRSSDRPATREEVATFPPKMTNVTCKKD
jgi:hypothetical protein